MPIEEVTYEGSPPSNVESDLNALGNVIKVESAHVENGPDDGWTINLRGHTDEEKFNTIANLVEETISGSDDIRRSYNRPLSQNWLIQIRY